MPLLEPSSGPFTWRASSWGGTSGPSVSPLTTTDQTVRNPRQTASYHYGNQTSKSPRPQNPCTGWQIAIWEPSYGEAWPCTWLSVLITSKCFDLHWRHSKSLQHVGHFPYNMNITALKIWDIKLFCCFLTLSVNPWPWNAIKHMTSPWSYHWIKFQEDWNKMIVSTRFTWTI